MKYFNTILTAIYESIIQKMIDVEECNYRSRPGFGTLLVYSVNDVYYWGNKNKFFNNVSWKMQML
jgi:hypothetical protein